MPSTGRAAGATNGRRSASAAGRADVSLYRGGAQPARGSAPAPDLAARIRLGQRALRGRVERREALIDIVRTIGMVLDPEKVGELVIDRAIGWLPAPCWVVVAPDGSGQLAVLAARGFDADKGRPVSGVAGWVIQRGEEFFTANLRRDARIADRSTASVVAFPLCSRGRRVGALIGFDPVPSAREPRLAPATLRALRVLLEPVGVALDNALLLQRAEALSVTDDLTQLYNSRYLNQVLRRETKRATRGNRPLSLLFIDLDGFKGINDSYGHLCGSRALVEAAAVIRGSARETDVVARFGGDEFALILPDTGTDGAFSVGERIRERIAAHTFLTSEGLHVRLTASVGVATLPDVAGSAEDLMKAADTAMYQVKDHGKNGIQAAAVPADT
jgi:diguanylate cyclase (GGDEF)-like protein